MKTIFIYTNLYPYSTVSESFLETELSAINPWYDINIVPVSKSREVRKIPQRFKLDNSVCDSSLIYKLSSFVFIFKSSLFPSLIKELTKGFNRRKFIDYLKYAYAAGLVYNHIKKHSGNSDDTIFYSYWFSYAPLAFAVYKRTHPESLFKFISRGHAEDIYTPEVSHVYYPLREYVLGYIDKLFVISSYGRHDLVDRFPVYADKIEVSRLGVKDNFCLETNKDNVIRIVSCSLVHQRKRVDLLFDSIRTYAKTHNDKEISWTHIGGGVLFDELKRAVDNTNDCDNLKIVLLGNKNNTEILDLYKHNKYTCYALTSKSEGIPVAIMEAIAAGFPVLSTDVGGIKEIINSERGRCLPVNYTQKEFDDALDYIVENNEALSRNAYDFYVNYYNSVRNYNEFYNRILNL